MTSKSTALKNTHFVFYLGTHKLSLFAGDLSGKEPKITKYKEVLQPAGFENGFVVNLEAAVSSIENLAAEFIPAKDAHQMEVYVVLGNSKLYTHAFSSAQYFTSQRTITTHDVKSVIEQTRSVSTLPLTEFILQIMPESFLVNDTEDVSNPIGLEAIRLGVKLRFFTMEFHEFRNISKAFESSDISVKGYWPRTLTVSEAVLSEEERSQGVVLVDIADHVTQVITWKDGYLKGVRSTENGGKKLSQAIAEKWGIDLHDAEKVKEHFGTLETHSDFGDELIPLVARGGKILRQIKRQEFQDSFLDLSSRWMADLLKDVDEMAASEKIIYPHFVVSGGGVRLSGFMEFLAQEFDREARIGMSKGVDGPQPMLVDPSLSAVYGLYRWLASDGHHYEKLTAPRGFMEKTLTSAKEWFCTYF